MSLQPVNSQPVKERLAIDQIEENNNDDTSRKPKPFRTRFEHARSALHKILQCFRPAAQIPLAWMLAFLSCACFTLTSYYAFGTTFLVRSTLISKSPSSTLLVLRILSAVTELFMASLMVSCFERLKWMLIASRNGAPILDFLSLGQGTGLAGLFSIAFNRVKGIASSRCWVALRALALLIIPAMSVLLLSDVSISQVYISSSEFPIAGGIGEFNASLSGDEATRLSSGILFASDFGCFLGNSKVSYPVSSITSDGSARMNSEATVTDDYVTSYYVAGGLQLISPWPTLNNSVPRSPLYTVRQNQGYQFEFTSLDASTSFHGDKDCTIYGVDRGAVLICLSATSRDRLDIKWIGCPHVDYSCLNDTSWTASTGWTTSLYAFRRTATVHYYRSNQSIAAVTDLSTPIKVPILPEDLFQVYNNSFNPNGSLGEFHAGQDFISYLSIFLLYSSTGSVAQNLAAEKLRNLAVLPFYYFQPTLLNPNLKVSPNIPASGLPDNLYTMASFSVPFYRLVVGKITLITYVTVGSAVILMSFVVLLLGSLEAVAGPIPDTSPFSALDLSVGCTMRGEDGSLHEKLRMCKSATGGELLQELKDMRICVRKAEQAAANAQRQNVS